LRVERVGDVIIAGPANPARFPNPRVCAGECGCAGLSAGFATVCGSRRCGTQSRRRWVGGPSGGPYHRRVSLHLYDTATRSVRPFESLRPGVVSLYNCGATVQWHPHIGHLRGAGVVYDVLRRWLEFSGYEVQHVRNVTDIDDKILAKAREAGRPWWEWAATHERSFSDAYDALGCLRPSIEPRATGHIPQILEMISELIDSGHAYPAAGDVYFAVRTQSDYGFLSGQRIDEMVQGETEAGGKRDAADFTLWKAAKPGEPSWASPWGPGRPGWHIECSAMARNYLGADFDIHGGGLDLIFPHHENEAAQSHGVGDGFARYWMHSHWVTMSGEKMSKSLGNILSVPAITEHTRPIALRYYLISVHYRSSIEYSREALDDAAKAFERIESFLHRASERSTGQVEIGTVPEAFRKAMDDDLSVPRALAVVHDSVRAGNAALAAGKADQVAQIASSVRSMLSVLGLDPWAAPWVSGDSDHRLIDATGTLIQALLQERSKARAERDFAKADAIRVQLAEAGFSIEDTKDGPVWSVAGGPSSGTRG
jgi:cysteinyl-tRNA synthetase